MNRNGTSVDTATWTLARVDVLLFLSPMFLISNMRAVELGDWPHTGGQRKIRQSTRLKPNASALRSALKMRESVMGIAWLADPLRFHRRMQVDRASSALAQAIK